MIFFLKNITVFKNYFFNVKKYGKAIEQPQGTLPVHLHSEQMDGQSTESKRRWARALVLSGPLLSLPQGGGPSTHSVWIPPPPIHGMWVLREAEPC